MITVALSIVIVLVTAVHVRERHLFVSRNEATEIREYLFSLLCFVYSLHLFRDVGGEARMRESRKIDSA